MAVSFGAVALRDHGSVPDRVRHHDLPENRTWYPGYTITIASKLSSWGQESVPAHERELEGLIDAPSSSRCVGCSCYSKTARITFVPESSHHSMWTHLISGK